MINLYVILRGAIATAQDLLQLLLDPVLLLRSPQDDKYTIKIAILAFTSVMLLGSSAYALKIHSPYVEKGIMEIESENRFDIDSRDREDKFRQHKIGFGYGLTSQWKLEIEGELEKENHHGYKYAATEIENIFQLTDVGEYWMDVGIKAAYEMNHENGGSDKVEGYLLLAKNVGKFTTIANIGFEKEILNNANRNPEGEIKWLGRYNYLPYLSPAVEYYGEFGEILKNEKIDEQKHRLGPMLHGKFGKGFKYETGVLFGLTRDTEDYAIKFNLEYEFPVGW